MLTSCPIGKDFKSEFIIMENNDSKFNEFELRTLREGLFQIRHNKDIISTEEFMAIDNKICEVVGEL